MYAAQLLAIVLVLGVTVSPRTVTPDAKEMCDQTGLTTCTKNYVKDISTRLLEGITYVCSGKESFKATLNSCIRERSVGCSTSLQIAYQYQVQTVHNHLFHMIDNFFCSPTHKCGVTQLMECYDVVLARLNIKQPKDLRKTAEFLDNLPSLLFQDEATYCSVTTDTVFKTRADCLNNRYKELFKTCVDDVIKSTRVTEEQSSHIFQSTIGQLTSSEYMEASRNGMCRKECTGFVERYRNIKICAKKYNDDVKYLFDAGTYAIDTSCNFLRNYSRCVHENIRDCPALANQLRINKDLSKSMVHCDLQINSALFPAASRSILAICLLHVILGRISL